MVRRSDRHDVLLSRAMRGAECWTDHRMVRSTIRLHICPLARKHKPKGKLDVKACRDPSVEDTLQQSVAEKLATIPDTDPSSIKDTTTLTADWTSICDSPRGESSGAPRHWADPAPPRKWAGLGSATVTGRSPHSPPTRFLNQIKQLNNRMSSVTRPTVYNINTTHAKRTTKCKCTTRN